MNKFEPEFKIVDSLEAVARAINEPHNGTEEHVFSTMLCIEHYTAMKKHLQRPLTGKEIREIHQMIFSSDEGYCPGQWRKCAAWVIQRDSGERHEYPHFLTIPVKMSEILPVDLNTTDPIEWYTKFQEIHPFKDGNGRVGGVVAAALHYIQKGEWLAPCQ